MPPTPYLQTDSNTLTKGWPQCCPVRALPLQKVYTTLAPLGQPTGTTTQTPLNKNERQQNPQHKWKGNDQALA